MRSGGVPLELGQEHLADEWKGEVDVALTTWASVAFLNVGTREGREGMAGGR